jgi:hypothetical protein
MKQPYQRTLYSIFGLIVIGILFMVTARLIIQIKNGFTIIMTDLLNTTTMKNWHGFNSFLVCPFLHVDLHNASRNPSIFLGQQTRLQKYI